MSLSIRPLGLWTPLLLITVAVAAPCQKPAHELALTVDIGKTTFFEDEPIFLVLRLTNTGSDTVWLMGFSAISASVDMSLRRQQGEVIPVGGSWIDYLCRDPDRCGDPLPSGGSKLSSGILQDRAGEERDFQRSLFTHHLGPGDYELHVRTEGVEAALIVFHVRERTPAETRELKELEAIRWQEWDRTGPTNYYGALFSWVARHHEDDPFLPLLLVQWLHNWMVELFARQENLDLDSLRIAVLKANRCTPAGAYIGQSMSGCSPQQR